MSAVAIRSELLETCLCGSQDGAIERHGEVIVRRCACGVARLVTTETAAEIEQPYSDGSYHQSSDRHPGCVPYADRYEHDRTIAAVRWTKYCSILGAYRTRTIRQTLDIGAGNGAFVDYLRDCGLRAEGLDLGCQAADRKWIHRSSTAKFVTSLRYDLVTYHDSLEHVVAPRSELAAARKLMRAGGCLVVDVPDVSVPAGQHHFKLEHLWYFTWQALADIVTDAGFDVIAVDAPIQGKIVVYGIAI